MLRTIKLHGAMAAKFGESYQFDVDTVLEAVRALTSQVKGAYAFIRNGEFRIIAENNRAEYDMGEEELSLELGKIPVVHVVPVPVGSKSQGVFKVVLGVAMLGIGFAVSAGSLGTSGALWGIKAGSFFALGAGMLLNGIGQMLSPTPTVDSNEKVDERPSYIFNGTLNICEEGNQIPVAYGTPFCGSLVISSGFSVDDVEQTLPDVKNLRASASGNTVTVSWSGVSGASDYVVRYGDSSATWDNYSKSFTVQDGNNKRLSGLSNGTYRIMVKARSGSVTSAVAYTSVTVDYTPSESDNTGGDGD